MNEPDYDLARDLERERQFNERENKWTKLREWLTTTTGQEFLDEYVYGTVGFDTKNSLLTEHGLQPTQGNREHFDRIVD